MNKRLILILLVAICGSNLLAKDKPDTHAKMPILAWYSIPASETTVERYLEMKEAGITHSLSFFSNADQVQLALDVAAKAGVQLVISCPELKSDPEKIASRWKEHPALAGYHLIDEPAISLFGELGKWGKRIAAVDSQHFCYVNLFPNFADTLKQLGTGNYRKYVSECARQIPLQFLSFDYYPVMKDRLSKTWYENLEQFSDEARKAGKPFWAFALTTNYDENHVTPQTLAAIRLQVYSNLAYGAQGIQYFTYWSATSVNTPSSEDQRGAPITATGKRSVVYDRIKIMSQEIQSVANVFLGAKVLSVRHAGKGMIPAGTIRLTSLPEPVKVLDAGGAPILVSILEKGDNRYMVVVNKDFLNSINLTVYGDETLKRVLKDGSIVPASSYEPTMEVDPGDAVIFQYNKLPTTNIDLKKASK